MKKCILQKMWPIQATRLKFVCLLPLALLALSSCESTEIVRPETEFEGIYTVQEVDPKDSYLLTLRKKDEATRTFTIENLANQITTPLEAHVSGSKLVINGQAFTNYLGNKYTISGEGTLDGTTLILYYTIEGYNGYDGAVFAKKQVNGKNGYE